MSNKDTLQPYAGFVSHGGAYHADDVRRVLADAHTHYEAQVRPRTGLAQPAGALPAHDPAKPNEQQGLYEKYRVSRTDGSDATGGKHHGCEHFVLDTTHDKHAKAALSAYADAVQASHPQLAADMRDRYGISAGDPGVPNPWRDVLLSAARARNWVVSEDDKPEHLLDLIVRVERIDAASPHQQRLREMAGLVDQLHAFANRLAPYLLPHEVTHDMASDYREQPDALLPDTREAAIRWANGAQLQYRYRNSGDEWRDCSRDGGLCLPNFLLPEIEYREKP